MCAGSLEKAKEVEDRIKQQYAESQHREKVLVRRLAAKEQEIQDYVVSTDFILVPYIYRRTIFYDNLKRNQ